MSENAGERPAMTDGLEVEWRAADLEAVNLPHQDGERHLSADNDAPTVMMPAAVARVNDVLDGRIRPAPMPVRPVSRPVKPPRNPIVGLATLVVLSLLVAFFAWVAAEPFWLSLGHGTDGAVTVTHCKGGGATYRCGGSFLSGDGVMTIDYATITGDRGDEVVGDVLSAVAVSDSARTVYTGDRSGLYLRWAIGFALMLVCAVLIPVATGAWRLEGRGRVWAVLSGYLIPLALAAGIIGAAWLASEDDVDGGGADGGDAVAPYGEFHDGVAAVFGDFEGAEEPGEGG